LLFAPVTISPAEGERALNSATIRMPGSRRDATKRAPSLVVAYVADRLDDGYERACAAIYDVRALATFEKLRAGGTAA